MAESSERELTPDEATCVAEVCEEAFVLCEGERAPRRSGGITGQGACDAIGGLAPGLELASRPAPLRAMSFGGAGGS